MASEEELPLTPQVDIEVLPEEEEEVENVSCKEYASGRAVLKISCACLLVLCLVGVVIASSVPNSPVPGYAQLFFKWVQSIPWELGMLVTTLVYSLATPFMFPLTPMNLAVGFLFGIIKGVAIGSLGCGNSVW